VILKGSIFFKKKHGAIFPFQIGADGGFGIPVSGKEFHFSYSGSQTKDNMKQPLHFRECLRTIILPLSLQDSKKIIQNFFTLYLRGFSCSVHYGARETSDRYYACRGFF